MARKLCPCAVFLTFLLLTATFFFKSSAIFAAPNHTFGPAAAQVSLKKFTVANGLEVTLFASEPMLRNPTDMDIDERGRIWITEGVNYRSSFQSWGILQPAGDRIVVLEDTNGDGIADKATTFYQGPEINSALGICILGNKVIVSCSPNVYVFTDTVGDGKAHKKEILFSGIGGVDHDHGVHAFSFGPDGKLYFNFGNYSGQLKDKDGNPVIDLAGNEVTATGRLYRNGMAFRCNPDGSDVEVLAHNFRNPYEVAVDSFGTAWQSDNDDDGNRSVRINYLMESGNYGFSDELTGAGWSEKRSNMEVDIPHRHWHQNDPGIVPNLLITGAGAPTGILIYEGKLLPEIFRHQMILADAGTRTIRAYPVQPDGAGYKTEAVDILTSTDTWFVPRMFASGRTARFYVADWNDAGVGGHDMADRDPAAMTGRIYRIAPKGSKPIVPKLDLQSAAACVRALQSPNLSTRYLAWNALRQMKSKGRRELLKLWSAGNDPRLRARALYLLAQIDGDPGKYIDQALKDPNTDLRITGLRIAREHKLDVIPYVTGLIHDPSPQVRRECAIALRHNLSPEAPKLWAALALQHDGKDRWYLEALGIGADRQENECFDAWRAAVGDHWNTDAGRDIIWRSRATNALPLLVKIILSHATLQDDRPRYFRALDYINSPGKDAALIELLLATFKASSPPSYPVPVRNAIGLETLKRMQNVNVESDPVLKAAFLDAVESARTKDDYIDLVRDFHLQGRNGNLLDLVLDDPTDPSSLEAMNLVLESRDYRLLIACLRLPKSAPGLVAALGNTRDSRIIPLLWPLLADAGSNVAVRRQVVRALCQTQKGAVDLLQLAQDGSLPADLKLTATTELNQVSWPDLKARAAQVLPPLQARNAEPLPPVAELLQKKGDAAHGAQVFSRSEVNCINCHRVNDKGVDFGPGLSEIGDKLGKDALYEAILDPSAGIAFGYEAWQLELKSGDEFAGIIVSETADELTIKDTRAIATRIKKSDITNRQRLKTSIMPAGLQQTMSAQDLVDLVEYLASLKKAVK